MAQLRSVELVPSEEIYFPAEQVLFVRQLSRFDCGWYLPGKIKQEDKVWVLALRNV